MTSPDAALESSDSAFDSAASTQSTIRDREGGARPRRRRLSAADPRRVWRPRPLGRLSSNATALPPAVVTLRARAIAYGAAIAAPAVALAVDLLLPPVLERAAFLPFVLATIVVAWLGGVWPGAVGVAFSSAGAAYALQQPVATSPDTPRDDVLRIVLFVVASAIACWLTIMLRSARDTERTDNESARRSRAQLLGVLESVAYPVAAIDRSARLLFANEAASAFFRLSDSQEMERAVGMLLSAAEGPPATGSGAAGPRSAASPPIVPATDGEHAEQPGVVLPDRAGRWQCRVTVGGVERFAAVQATPIRDEAGATEGLVVAWRDATEDHEAEVAREAFMGILAHELRTPITTIYGGAHILVSRDDRLPAPTRREVAHDILHEATRLSRIADNLLVLSRVERGQLQIVAEPILLEPLVRAVVESEAIRWPATNFDLVVEPGTRIAVSGAPGYVEQVLRNLLSNAAKYSPPGSNVVTHLEAASAELVIRVVDDGPGFGANDGARLFELYYRSPDTATKAPGSGIGLYVCRRLMEAMGGRIWASPREAGGSEFGFALPLAVDEAADEPRTLQADRRTDGYAADEAAAGSA